jgi:hypothetical protein
VRLGLSDPKLVVECSYYYHGLLGLAQNGIGIYLKHAVAPPSSSAFYFTNTAAAQKVKLDLQKFFRVGKGY